MKYTHSITRVVLAGLFVLLAFGLRQGLEFYFGLKLPPFLTLFPSVMFIAVRMGLRYGLGCTALGSVIAWFWILAPKGRWVVQSTSDLIALAVFVGTCVAISIIAERLRQQALKLALISKNEELRDVRTRMDMALECTPDAIFIADTEGNLEHFNQAFATFHRFTSRQQCSRSFSDYSNLLEVTDSAGLPVPPELWALPRALRGETGVNVEFQLRRTDTGQSWIGSYNFSPLRDESQQIVGAVVSARDVTAQSKIAHELELSEARFRRLFEDNGSIFLLIDPHSGRIVDANYAAAIFYGYSRDQLRQMLITDINTLGESALSEHRARALRGESRCFNWTHRLASGELRQIEAYSSPVENNGRKLLFSVIRDVTESLRTESLLRTSEQRYRTAFQTSLDAILITEFSTGRIVESNAALRQILGFSENELHGRTTAELQIWVDTGARQRMLDGLNSSGRFRDFEFRFRRQDGAIRWGMMSASQLVVDDMHCILTVLRDVTDARLAAESLRLSEERYRTAFQTSIDAIAITRIRDGVYVDVNHRFYDILGYQREDVIGRSAFDLNIWFDIEERAQLIREIHERGICQDMHTRFRKKSGELFWSIISVARIDLDGEACMMAMIRDISDAKMAEERIHSLAYLDTLTGLANRRLLLERLRPAEAAAASAHNRALLFVDIDNFRTLNDAFGHPSGDQVLREAGARLSACVRDAGTVARVSGDEFVILLEDLDENTEMAAAQAGSLAEAARTALTMPFHLEQREWNTNCCIGITIFRFADPTQVMQQADIALAQAKCSGRGTTHFFAPALQAAVDARATLEDEMRQGLRRNEFLLYFQPQIDGEKIVGAEVLIRWQHPSRGLLGPGDFITLAEESRLIEPLGEWVFEAACQQIALWSASPCTASLELAVNVSPLEVLKPGFVTTLMRILERTGASPLRIKLEITESMLLENIEQTIERMQALKALGLRFSIDDFGTGYSSLAYLKRIPLDQLKIDISFVRDIVTDPSSSAIASTIISLGRAMGLSVIAEGVESNAQRQHLSSLGCTLYQGYLFSRPVPLAEFELLLSSSANEPLRSPHCA